MDKKQTIQVIVSPLNRMLLPDHAPLTFLLVCDHVGKDKRLSFTGEAYVRQEGKHYNSFNSLAPTDQTGSWQWVEAIWKDHPMLKGTVYMFEHGKWGYTRVNDQPYSVFVEQMKVSPGIPAIKEEGGGN